MLQLAQSFCVPAVCHGHSLKRNASEVESAENYYAGAAVNKCFADAVGPYCPTDENVMSRGR